MDKIRVLLADDHTLFRRGVREMLEAEEDINIVAEAATGREALEQARAIMPDVILMDLQMPVMDGLAAIKHIRAKQPEVFILVLTTYDSDADIVPAIEAGATGYLLKDAPPESLFRAVRSAAQGEGVFAPGVVEKITQRLSRTTKDSLSAREIEVLDLAAQGKSNKEIADKLHITEATVKTHVSSILAKLNLPSRTRAALYALKTGLVSLEEVG